MTRFMKSVNQCRLGATARLTLCCRRGSAAAGGGAGGGAGGAGGGVVATQRAPLYMVKH